MCKYKFFLQPKKYTVCMHLWKVILQKYMYPSNTLTDILLVLRHQSSLNMYTQHIHSLHK